MINTVIFDLDGTLIDSEKVIVKRYQKVFKEYGYENVPTIKEYVYNCCGRTTPHNLDYCINTYNMPITREEALTKWLAYEIEDNNHGYDIKPHVYELMDYLSTNNYKIVLATSSSKERAINILKQYHIYHYFHSTICQEDITRSKPDPQIYLLAAQSVQSNLEECLVIEDSSMGVKGGHDAKMNVICSVDMLDPKQETVQLANRVVHSLLEVIDFLKEQS